tara:strand:- start:22 stop:177 length:156 start_codon:yes stop_codon:yes gene_type:complete
MILFKRVSVAMDKTVSDSYPRDANFEKSVKDYPTLGGVAHPYIGSQSDEVS